MNGALDAAAAEVLVVEHLGDTPRAEHSRIVGELMAHLARRLGMDVELWRVVGLVHDLDYFVVAGDWSRHGLLTTHWLAGRLPPDALTAIEAHDHRTGVVADGPLARALRLADALAVFDQRAGRRQLMSARRLEEWRPLADDRPFLVDIIGGSSAALTLDFAVVQEIVRELPVQRHED
jgi:hypothetical protein